MTINRHFTTGPVAGFLVDDIQAATAELRSAGVEILFESGVDDSGNAWVHFRAPDGNIYEFTQDPGVSRPHSIVAKTAGWDPTRRVVDLCLGGAQIEAAQQLGVEGDDDRGGAHQDRPDGRGQDEPAQASTPAARGTASRL